MRRPTFTTWLLIALLLGGTARVTVPAPTGAQGGAVPVAIQIPAALVDTVVEPLAIVNAVPQLPTSPWTVGWYQPTGGLGVPGNPVFYGLVDWPQVGPAVFHFADLLQPGTSLDLTGGDGYQYRYGVEWVQSYPRSAAPINEIFTRPAAEHLLTLFFDGPPYNFGTGEYENVVVVRARQTASPPAPTMPAAVASAPAGCPVPPETLLLPTSGRVYPYPVVAPYPYADRSRMGLPQARAAPEATVAAIDGLLADATTCEVAVREARLLPDGYILALIGPAGALPLHELTGVVSLGTRGVSDDTRANLFTFMLFVEEPTGWHHVPHPVG